MDCIFQWICSQKHQELGQKPSQYFKGRKGKERKGKERKGKEWQSPKKVDLLWQQKKTIACEFWWLDLCLIGKDYIFTQGKNILIFRIKYLNPPVGKVNHILTLSSREKQALERESCRSPLISLPVIEVHCVFVSIRLVSHYHLAC